MGCRASVLAQHPLGESGPAAGLDAASVVVIVAELAVALILLAWTTGAPLEGARYWFIGFPLQLFAGWVSVATFVNLSSTMLRARLSNQRLPDPRRLPVALALIGVTAVLCAATALATGSLAYATAAAWGFATLGAKADAPVAVRGCGVVVAVAVLVAAFATDP